MKAISRLERADRLDGVVKAGQRVAQASRLGLIRDGLHGTWLGHTLHPLLVQAEAVPHLVGPGWHRLIAAVSLPENVPVRIVLGESPVVMIRADGQLQALADRSSTARSRSACPAQTDAHHPEEEKSWRMSLMAAASRSWWPTKAWNRSS
jgi:hypothetical protein